MEVCVWLKDFQVLPFHPCECYLHGKVYSACVIRLRDEGMVPDCLCVLPVTTGAFGEGGGEVGLWKTGERRWLKCKVVLLRGWGHELRNEGGLQSVATAIGN